MTYQAESGRVGRHIDATHTYELPPPHTHTHARQVGMGLRSSPRATAAAARSACSAGCAAVMLRHCASHLDARVGRDPTRRASGGPLARNSCQGVGRSLHLHYHAPCMPVADCHSMLCSTLHWAHLIHAQHLAQLGQARRNCGAVACTPCVSHKPRSAPILLAGGKTHVQRARVRIL